MVAVQVLDKHNNMQAKSHNDRVNLDIGVAVSLPQPRQLIKTVSITPKTILSASRQKVDHLLNSTSTMHVERNVYQVLSDGFADEVALIIGCEFEQFLAEVIAKGIGHELSEMAESLPEYHVPMLRCPFFQFLLQVPAPVLVFA